MKLKKETLVVGIIVIAVGVFLNPKQPPCTAGGGSCCAFTTILSKPPSNSWAVVEPADTKPIVSEFCTNR